MSPSPCKPGRSLKNVPIAAEKTTKIVSHGFGGLSLMHSRCWFGSPEISF